jgi:predicted XRE-type DNA-binding protein
MNNKAGKLRTGVRRGSGNVFADLGLPNAAERLAKAELARQIAGVIARARWTQEQAAAKLGIDQPKVSGLLSGRLAGFSTDRLIRFLTALGQDVEIVVRPHRTGESRSGPAVRVVRHVA